MWCVLAHAACSPHKNNNNINKINFVISMNLFIAVAKIKWASGQIKWAGGWASGQIKWAGGLGRGLGNLPTKESCWQRELMQTHRLCYDISNEIMPMGPIEYPGWPIENPGWPIE
jgi:hypothetical protein